MDSEGAREILRSAIRSPVMDGDGKMEKAARRVNFPADDSLVTGYLEPPNPWAKALDLTSDDLIDVYKTSCETLQIKPINRVIQQLQQIESMANRVECLSLKGEKLDNRHYEALEEIFKRVQFDTIDVEAVNLDEETSVALFDMIEYYESARNLNIAFNKNLNYRSWQACARMLKKTPCLESLDARSTQLNEHIMQLLCRTLRSGSNLTTLHFENCNLSGRICTLLMNALKVNSSLSELYLAENKLNSTDALQIGNLLRSNTRLKLLDLRCNQILDAGIAHIVDGLNDQSIGPGEGLETLILWSNQLTCYSTLHLVKIVVKSSSLRTLNLGNNNITNEGVFHLKEALMKNRTLTNLGLQQTKITCEGAVAIAEYIADNPSIELIDLRENHIKMAGLLALSLSMRVNRSVTRLDLDKDPKKESIKDLQDQHQKLLLEIMECCERNNTATHLTTPPATPNNTPTRNEDAEKLSESVSRLLSLFDRQNPPKTPTPRIVLPDPDPFPRSHSVALDLSAASSPSLSPVNPALLSPPAVCPSPPKSRFRVSRVVVDAVVDPFLSSAGNTPMPSPVPSPGHTPFASPGCTPFASPGSSPFPSPLSSPMGSPLSSPFRNGFPLPHPCAGVVKMPLAKPSLLADPLKKRAAALRTWNGGAGLRPMTSRGLFADAPPAPAAPPTSPAPSDTATTVDEVPPNTPEDAPSEWGSEDDLSELRMSCGSESWMDSLSDGLVSGGSSPTSESCPSLSSYANGTTPPPTPNASISTTTTNDISLNAISESVGPVSLSVSPASEPATTTESRDSGLVATPDDDASTDSRSYAWSEAPSSSLFAGGAVAPPCSPTCLTALQATTNKRALSPSTSNDGAGAPAGVDAKLTLPSPPCEAIRKKKKTTADEDRSPTRLRDIKLAEPSRVRLFGGAEPSGSVSPRALEPDEAAVAIEDREAKCDASDESDVERRRQIEDLKRSLEEAKVAIGRRASTGSFPGVADCATAAGKSVVGRRTSTMVDELIQKQLMAIHRKVCNNSDEYETTNECEISDGNNNLDGCEISEECDEVQKTDADAGDEPSATLLRLSVQISDDDEDGEVRTKFARVDDEQCQTSSHAGTEESDSAPITVAFIHGELNGSPVRQRLMGTSESSSHLLVGSQCLDAGQLFQLFEDFNDGLPSIEASDILSRPNQESTTPETLKTF